MSIKKAYEPIINLLVSAVEADAKVKVSAILEQVRELASAKVARGEGSSFIKDASGTVVAIHDYYFKRWMPLVGDKAVEFGAKAKTSTGLNTMCKEGVSHWTKQQRAAQLANEAILTKLKAKEITADDIDALQAEIEVTRKAIAPTELGFASEAEVRDYLAANGITL